MNLLYNWQLFDYPIPSSDPISKYITPPKLIPDPQPQTQSLNSTLQAMSVRSPIISIAFCYILEQQKGQQPQIHLFPQMTIFENKLQISLLQQRKQNNYIYQLIKVENCQCFETMLTFVLKVKYIQGHSSKVTSIQKLIGLVGARKLNSHSFQTHSVAKKQLTIDEPVVTEMKYSPKGYFMLKLTRSQQTNSPVYIQNVDVLAWLCEDQTIKQAQSKRISPVNSIVKLNPKEIYSMMFKLPQNLKGPLQIPLSIVFSFDMVKSQKFKIIKYLKIE